ncbi:FAD binding domain-containing protein [Acuticoccus mangrovi]|uniref:FAD binding domain-containing protein n=1 Tax=Acuticoccus mangrovi TaxID=2796142 RepID=A0A934IQU0_9HYPH|nr:FAD binding domain-containing protein [Acuticoccus mangrovi]MBJ3776990.1 FAD binding domain-containing protein [Acuticoccus mangrovi]
MKAANFAYHAPTTRQELFALLAELDDARMIAGGQSLVPMMNFRLAAPENLVDLNTVGGLDGIEVAGDRLVIGAMTRQRAAERSATVARVCPLLVETLGRVGVQQIRNRGTVGGSIAHFDPTAELPVAAVALDAEVVLESLRGARRMPVADFGSDYLTTEIEPDEVLTAVEVPLWPEGHGAAFDEVTRRGDSYAIVSVAALVLLDAAGRVARLSVAIGGLTHAPARLAVDAMVGAAPEGEALAALAETARALPADGDGLMAAEDKQHLAATLTERVVRRAGERARRSTGG